MSKERILVYIERLHDVTKNIEGKLQNEKVGNKDTKKMTGTDFENVVYDSLIEAGFEKEEISHSTQKFPDFVLEDLSDGEKIGVEVKKTDAAKWEVIGGSIYESLKNDIEDTYVLMAKMGGDKPEVRLKKYEECIADLKVTHDIQMRENGDGASLYFCITKAIIKRLGRNTGKRRWRNDQRCFGYPYPHPRKRTCLQHHSGKCKSGSGKRAGIVGYYRACTQNAG